MFQDPTHAHTHAMYTRAHIFPTSTLKWMALTFKLSVLKKTHIWKPFNVLIPLNDAFLFRNKSNQILFGPPPPLKKNAGKGTVAIWLQAHVSVYQQPVTLSFTRSRLSDSAQSHPFIKKYYLIIVAFSSTHFSIHDMFYTKEGTLSFNERATHFNIRPYFFFLK